MRGVREGSLAHDLVASRGGGWLRVWSAGGWMGCAIREACDTGACGRYVRYRGGREGLYTVGEGRDAGGLGRACRATPARAPARTRSLRGVDGRCE